MSTTTVAKALEDQEFFHSSLASRPLPFDKYGAPPAGMPTRGAIPSFFTATEFKPVLTESFLRKYMGKQPAWGPIGYPVYKRTYARPLYLSDYGVAETFAEFYGKDSPYLNVAIRTEEFWETCARVINGLWHILRCHSFRKNIEFSESKAARKAQAMFEKLWNFKWIPPGRGLWMMGTRFMYLKGGASLNNCFAYETEIITSQGTAKIGDLCGKTATLLTTNGKWIEAPIRSFGKQKLMKVTLGRQGDRKEIFATPEHRWFVWGKEDGLYQVLERFTNELKPNQRLQYCFGQGIKEIRPSSFGIAHGISFGDGSRLSHDGGASWLYLCGDKDAQLAKYFPLSPVTHDSAKSSQGALRVADLPRFFKELPSLTESKSYLYGWLAGYIAADGHVSRDGSVRLSSINKNNLLFVKDVCYKLGIGTYSLREEVRVSNLTNQEYTMYHLGFIRQTLGKELFLIEDHRKNFIEGNAQDKDAKYWRVIAIEETERSEEVFCPQVPETAAFALADNILTGNCAFISTADIVKEIAEPFMWAMDMSMLGVGVGFDTLGAGKVKVTKPSSLNSQYKIEDSREGWAESVGAIIAAYLSNDPLPTFDYSSIRPRGTPIRGFGGIAEGPAPLQKLHENLVKFFNDRLGKFITSADIVDIFNEIGACVVSGNVRRSAQIALGNADDEGYITLKHNPDAHPACWNSNNSVYGNVGMDYKRVAELITSRGEPGIVWLDSARAYGRMGDAPNYRDKNATGTNPCSEQTLHNYELCTLVENFVVNHDTEEEFFDTLKQSYLYAKAVTLVPTHSKKTNRVMGKNSRIGCSLSGLQQARVKFGTRRLLNMLDAGYQFIVSRDENYSDWLQVRNSIKLTSIKPSGTVSLLCGVSPGIHYPIERTYLRRVRFSAVNSMVETLRGAGYRIYPDPDDPNTTVIIDFPVKEPYVDRVEREVSIWEQLEFDAAIQSVWSDNQVSITVKFDPYAPDISNEISRALELYETRLKSISFLPFSAEEAGYEYPPYFAISDEQYEEEIAPLQTYSLSTIVSDDVYSDECSTGACPVR